MFKRCINWLESRIDVFAPFDDRETPPASLARFAVFYLKAVRGWLFVVFLSALLLAGVEASLLLLVGRFVDLLNKTKPDELFPTYGVAFPRRSRRAPRGAAARSIFSTRASSIRSWCRSSRTGSAGARISTRSAIP